MKARTATVSFELHETELSRKEIARRVMDFFFRAGDGTPRQVHVNIIDATKPKKAKG